MPNLEYDFNNDDYQLITDGNNTAQLTSNDYVRITVYENLRNEIYRYIDSDGVRKKAVFYSAYGEDALIINTGAFFNEPKSSTKTLGMGSNDFPIYTTENEDGTKSHYLKPNELFNQKQFPEGNYSIKVDFLKQLNPLNVTPTYLSTLPYPSYFQEVDINSDTNLNNQDIQAWSLQGRPDISSAVLQHINGGEQFPNYAGEGQEPKTSEYYYNPNFVGYTYDFIIKEISTSRKEIRLKLLNDNLIKDSQVSKDIENILTSYGETFDFKHVLNVGDGNHIPITNFHFDAVSDGKDNQSVILRLYKPLPLSINNLKLVSIEREVFVTQTTDIYYFSEIESTQRGLGLNPDQTENWINADEGNSDFQNYNELTQSLTDISLKQFTSGSSHYYPNLNTNFNEFENHTFFGSAKRKLENFKNKVETIQSYHSQIEDSLSTDTTMTGDSLQVKKLRKDLFNKIDEEINSFTPYERFLYFDGQSESTASAPGVGRNYADTIATQTSYTQGSLIHNDGITLGPSEGFSEVYKHSSEKPSGNNSQDVGLFKRKYYVSDKPFFNYDKSIYLSFLMKADSGSALTFTNSQKDYGVHRGEQVNFPEKSKFKENLLNPPRTSSVYQRYIFHTSHSHFIPAASVNNDLHNIGNFTAASTEFHILSQSKSGSKPIKDSGGHYQSYSTVTTSSGIPFKGSIMPSGELFDIGFTNQSSASLSGYWNIDNVASASSLVISNAINSSGTTNGNATLVSGVTASAGVQVHNRQYGSSYFFASESSARVAFETATNYNFNRDNNFSLSIWAKRFHKNTGSADSSDGNVQAIFTRGGAGQSYGIDYYFPANQIRAGVRGNASQFNATFNTTDDLLKWNHIVFTYTSGSSTGIKLYVNGELKSSTTTTGASYQITGSSHFSHSAAAAEPELLSIGGNDTLGGTPRYYNGFLQYPRVYNRAIPADEVKQLYLTPDGKTETRITDVKVTFKNPTNAKPFSDLYHTSSAEWTNWYNGTYDSASSFDTDNIHSLENNLPLYIQESSEYNDLKDFLSLQGEQYDIIRNHIDSVGTLNDRGYKETDSPPSNTYPMLLENLGYQAINPFSGSLTDSLANYLNGVTSIDDIKNNTWRKTLNNLIYIYKSKGTLNSVRGLLNVYGYPPDIINLQEFGGSQGEDLIKDSIPSSNNQNDTDLINQTGGTNFKSSDKKLSRYTFQNNSERVFNLDWYMDSANINSIEFVYKHQNTTNVQTIFKSSGSKAENLWDLRLVPSADGLSSSFAFRLNNSKTGSLAIATNALSMSTAYSRISDGQLWNVMLQRMTSSTSTNITNEYRLHSSLQNDKSIETYNYVTMSVSGGLSIDNNNLANQNFIGSGSRHALSSSNLVVGETVTGSLAEIKAWNSPLSKSKFRLHTLNKFSVVGNTINSHEKELVYHFRLNENFSTSSISASNQFLTISDSSPKTTLSTDYSFQKTGSLFANKSVYGFDLIKQVTIGLKNDNQDIQNDSKIIISPKFRSLGNLNPTQKSTLESKNSTLKNSVKIELDKSLTNTINEHILNRVDNFDFQKLYGDPKYYFSSSYIELDNLREDFFKAFPIQVDINKFIKANESISNHSLSEGLKTLVPARSTFSDKNSGFGVTIKPTIFERNKYQHKKHSVETNPNTATGSIVFVKNTEYKQQSFTSNVELPYSQSISIGNAYSANRDYIHSPALQPDGVTGSIEYPKSGSSVSVNENILFESTKIIFPYSGSISMGNTYITESAENSYVTPHFLQFGGITSSIVFPYSGSINYIPTHYNKSFVNIHDSWGTGVDKTHFINFAGGTGSNNNYNVGHIDTRNVFHMIGDNEYYSSSFGKASDFSDEDRFYNRTQITENLKRGVEYNSLIGGTPGTQTGRMMGKTRYFLTGSDGTILSLPSNHVTKFSQPFKEQMYKGTQYISKGFFPKTSTEDKDVDHSTSSFYSVTVTGGERQIIVKEGGAPTLGTDGKITYN